MGNINELLKQDIVAVNLGLEGFYTDLKDQKVQVVHVNWKPPAANQDKINSLLANFKK
jgi:FdrA protein